MPSPRLTVAIVLFWLSATGWLLWREYGGRLRAGDAPPFVIELADEVTRKSAPINWAVLRNDKKIGTARTFVEHLEAEDLFELRSEMNDLKLLALGPIDVRVPKLKNVYRVTRDGELRASSADLTLSVLGLEAKAHVAGEVKGGRFERRCRIDWPLGVEEPPLEPTEAPRGSVLNPLHPVNRITGLRPGRVWRMPANNPLDDALAPILDALMKKGNVQMTLKPPAGPREFEARVLSATQPVNWDKQDHDCHVIEMRAGDHVARTFVRVRDGLVLRQEAEVAGDQMVLQRD